MEGGGRRAGRATARSFSLLVLALALGGLVRIGVNNRTFVLAHPENLLWIGVGGAASLLVFLASGTGVSLRRSWPWLGYGILAGYLASALEAGAREHVRASFDGSLSLRAALSLGLAAGAGATFGLWLVVRFVHAIGGLRSGSKALEVGLSIGLGAAWAGTLLAGENEIVRRTVADFEVWAGLPSVVATAAMALASGVLLAGAVFERRLLPLLLVWAGQGAFAVLHAFGGPAPLSVASALAVLLAAWLGWEAMRMRDALAIPRQATE